MRIRHASADDVKAVKELELACGLSVWTQKDYHEIAANREGWIFDVAEENDGIIGYICARLITKQNTSSKLNCGPLKEPAPQKTDQQIETTLNEAEICNIGVARESRGKGVGSKLIKTFIEILSEGSPFSIFLEVRESNTGAIRFYRRHGFAIYSHRKNYYADPPEGATLMKLGPVKTVNEGYVRV